MPPSGSVVYSLADGDVSKPSSNLRDNPDGLLLKKYASGHVDLQFVRPLAPVFGARGDETCSKNQPSRRGV